MRYESAGAFRMALEARLNQALGGAEIVPLAKPNLHSWPLAPPPTWAEDYASMAAAVRLSASDIDSGFELLQSFWQTALAASTPSVPDSDR